MISASTKRVPRPVRGRRAAWVRADGGHTKGSGMERDLLALQSTVLFMRRALPPYARMRAPMRKACVWSVDSGGLGHMICRSGR